MSKKDEVVSEKMEAEVKKEPAKGDAYWNELVPFYAFEDGDKYTEDITVGVNGRIWRIKRGEEVMIPRKVYEVLVNSQKQDQKTMRQLSRMAGLNLSAE